MNPASTEKTNSPLQHLTIAVKGAGEMASAVAWRLFQAHLRRIFMMEIPHPLAVRRGVSFCEAIHNGRHVVEGVTAMAVPHPDLVAEAWAQGRIAVLNDPTWQAMSALTPDVCVDAILAKKNLGTRRGEATTVIGLGPGFSAGQDVHMVIETNRGHHLGRIITQGSAEPNTGIPGDIGGFDKTRVIRAPVNGQFATQLDIGDQVARGDTVGQVGEAAILAEIDGVVRGLIRPGTAVHKGWKLGDIDPRGRTDYCHTISDKARAIAGSVLEAILRVHLSDR